jgi:ATP-dependent Zn protease
MIAERIILGACGHSYHTNDKQEALDLVQSLVFEGLHSQTMPKEIRQKYYERALEELKQYETETEALLMQHKDTLLKIAHDLVEFKTLSAGNIQTILEKNGAAHNVVVATPA